MAAKHIALLLVLVGHVRAEPTCESDFAVFRHPSDCSQFYKCSHGSPYAFGCPASLVYSVREGVCVHPGSPEDDCDQGGSNTPLTVEERCEQDPTAVFPHEIECHQFYNCSLEQDFSYYFQNKHQDECPYPQFFDAQTLQCEDYDKVECGTRRERVNACDYKYNTCPRSHCIPCYVRYSPCDGLEDGPNVFKSKKWTPVYAICQDDRFIGEGRCETDEVLGMAQFFSPVSNKCVSLYEVPRDQGGYLLSCKDREDGAHPDDATQRANLYYTCSEEQRTGVHLCPDRQVYGNLTTPCVTPELTVLPPY